MKHDTDLKEFTIYLVFFSKSNNDERSIEKTPEAPVALGTKIISFVTQIQTVLEVKGSSSTNHLGKPGKNCQDPGQTSTRGPQSHKTRNRDSRNSSY